MDKVRQVKKQRAILLVVLLILIVQSCSNNHVYKTDWLSFVFEESLSLNSDENLKSFKTATYTTIDSRSNIDIYRLYGNPIESEYSLMQSTLDEMHKELNDGTLLEKESIKTTPTDTPWLYYLWRMHKGNIYYQSFFYCKEVENSNKCLLFSTQYPNDVSTDSIFEADFSKARKLFDSIEFK